ncbi:6-phosphogluconate dehydrogenase C-terminal domain-like protein [Sistotremastrum niveocremeum HHB9708]|uniref:6-phosphogluconate dehydrogenase C-terminal domain-like protein n=2 Tax=Sistotremastraceae TaxID=3402574 RepID=A0A164Y9J2_9AGAM|nr:6-phosphogluconate dehydrogenase C-terminal domain-like protein [Sistotremastrum niveocremeum HHB9708]KZT40139.1 6-phosphogluconate dehydrogenase C-terminal domain-like protein [Sistotremastrum suecicum HHB10207 ss-3]
MDNTVGQESSTIPKEDILLVGFGAVGVIYAYALQSNRNVRVSVVARSNYQTVQDRGVDIHSTKFGHISGWRPDRVFPSVDAAAKSGPYSFVVVCTKCLPDVLPTSTLLAPFFEPPYVETHSQPVYALLQNGVGIERDFYNHAIMKLGNRNISIISGALYIAANLRGDIVEHSEWGGSIKDGIIAGTYRPFWDENPSDWTPEPTESKTLGHFAQLFEPASVNVTIVDDIQPVKFQKNIINAAISSLSAITMVHPSLAFRDDAQEAHLRAHFSALLEELRLIASSVFGIGLFPPENMVKLLDTIVALYKSSETQHFPSIMLDRELGKPMEVEVILGECVRLARRKNVSCPRLETTYAILSVIQYRAISKS